MSQTTSQPPALSTRENLGEPGRLQTFLLSRFFLLVFIPLLWAGAYLTNLGVRDLRFEEGRRATPALEMLTSGHWLVPTLAHDPYFNKPPLFFWIIAGLGKIFGTVDTFVARLPSALAVLAGAYVMLRLGRQHLSRVVRTLAALLFLATPVMMDKGAIAEIDAFLSLLVAASWAIFLDGYQPAGQTLKSWVGIGILMAVAILAKAPAGPVEFYLPLAAFLLWEKQFKRLLSWGHLLCITLFLLPTCIWIASLLMSHQFPLGPGMVNWLRQLGLDYLPGMEQVLAQAAPSEIPVVQDDPATIGRYLRFTPEVLAMILPWGIWTIVGLWPRIGQRLTMPRPVWRFLVCGVAALVLAFWIWPSARPRHMMAVAFPGCLLAAQVIVDSWPLVTRPFHRGLAGILAYGPLAIGLAGGILWKLGQKPGAVHIGVIGPLLLLLGCGLTTALLLSLLRPPKPGDPVLQNRSAHATDTALGISLALALSLLAGRAMVMVDFYPPQAARDATRRTRVSLQAALAGIPAAWPLFTTRTFPFKGNDSYNAQFYLAPRLRGLHHFSDLPLNQPTAVVLIAEELPELPPAIYDVTELGRAKIKEGRPELVVVQVLRKTAAASQVE